MSEFHRMITYLYLYEQGMKNRNIGFAKVERREQRCLLEIHMKNTGYSLSPIPVYFYVEKGAKLAGIPLGNFGLTRGSGDFKAVLDANNLKDSGYGLDSVKGIYIPLTGQIMLVSQWDDDEFRLEDFIGLEDDVTNPQISGTAASSENGSSKPVSDDNISADKAFTNKASAEKISASKASAEKISAGKASTEKISAGKASAGNDSAGKIPESQGLEPDSPRKASPGSVSDGTASDRSTTSQQADRNPISDVARAHGPIDAPQAGNVPDAPQADSTAAQATADSQSTPEEEAVPAQEEQGSSPAHAAIHPIRQENKSSSSAPTDALKAVEALPRPPEEAAGFRTISGKNTQNFSPNQRETQASSRKNTQASGQNQREAHTSGNSQQAKHTQADEPENWDLRWRFILENYPVMTPFAGDDRTLCVRMELKDLRQLPKQFWYFGNNSFLLHGFFNYRYFILGMTEEFGIKKWFIGVPGVFQNPERVMAALFGFPEFRSEKDSPINTGEFGYWYRYLNELSEPSKK